MAPEQPPHFADLAANIGKIKMPFRWLMFDEDGVVTEPAANELNDEVFESQADAESWLGEYFPELLEGGIESVSLLENDDLVYGPMSLRA